MFQTILRRELQGILSSFIFLSSLAVLTVMVLLSALIQARYYKSLVEDYALRQVIHQTENSERAIRLTRPPPLLLPFSTGYLIASRMSIDCEAIWFLRIS
jgi:hypothetical protein